MATAKASKTLEQEPLFHNDGTSLWHAQPLKDVVNENDDDRKIVLDPHHSSTSWLSQDECWGQLS